MDSKKNENFTQDINSDSISHLIKDATKKLLDNEKEKYSEIFGNLVTENNIFKTNVNKFFTYLYSSNMRYYSVFMRRINYINTKIFSNQIMNLKSSKKPLNEAIVINSLIIIKLHLNSKKSAEQFFRVLHMFTYIKIIPINSYKFIFEILISILSSIISNNKNYSSYIENLIESIINFPLNSYNDAQYNNIVDIILNLLDKYFYKNSDNLILIRDYVFWLKLLDYKLDESFKNNETLKKIISFLVNIYKYNINYNILYNGIFKFAAINLNLFGNCLDFLSELFKQENFYNKSNNNFLIKSGFYIKLNNPFSIHNINIDSKEYSFIFSFKLNTLNYDEIILLNIYRENSNNSIIKFTINKSQKNQHPSLKIIYNSDKIWEIDNIEFSDNKNYLLCITQKSPSIFNIKSTSTLSLYLNNINNDGTIKTYETDGNYIDFNGRGITCECGTKNFCGFFGDLIILNKEIEKTSINNLFDLKGDYGCVLSNKENNYDLVAKYQIYDSNILNSIIFFKNLNYNCIFKLLTNEYNENFIHYLNKGNMNIHIVKFEDSINLYKNEKGIDLLIFQLYKIFNDCSKNSFNYYVYKILKFFYDFIRDDLNINDINKSKFNTFLLSLLVILYGKNNSLNKDNDIYLSDSLFELFIEYIIIFNKNNLYKCTSVIFSILLEQKFFNLKKLLLYKKARLIELLIINIKLVMNSKSNFIFSSELIYKILSIDFLVESKNCNHKKFKEMFISLLKILNIKEKEESSIQNLHKMITKTVINYIINLKSDCKQYHYLKYIFINSSLIDEKFKTDENFLNFLDDNILFNKENLNFDQEGTSKIESGSKYCSYKLLLSYLIKDDIFSKGDEDKNEKDNFLKKNEYININDINFNSDFFFSNENKDNRLTIIYKYSLIKCIFITCFNIDNQIKLHFVKKDKFNIFFNKNKTEEKYNTVNINIMDNINYNKFISKFDPLIDYLQFFYEKFKTNENSKNNKVKTFNNNETTENNIDVNENLNINNIHINNKNNSSEINNKDDNTIGKEKMDEFFELINYFLIELFTSNDILNAIDTNSLTSDKQNFMLNLLSSNGISKYFNLYFKYDSTSAISLLEKIIIVSFIYTKEPFYFKFINGGFILGEDSIKNKENKNSLIITIISRIINISDITKNHVIKNCIKILLIINDYINKDIILSDSLEKYIKVYLRFLLMQKFYYCKYIFNIRNEPTNLLEIMMNILFKLYKMRNYDFKFTSLIFEFINLGDKTIFYDVDKISINLEIIKTNNDIKNPAYPNKALMEIFNNKNNISCDLYECENFEKMFYTIYFLFYFIDKKTHLQTKDKTNNNIENSGNNEYNSNSLNNNAPLLFINNLVTILFENSIRIFGLYMDNNLSKNNLFLKANNLTDKYSIQMYHHFLKYFMSKISPKNKKMVSLLDIEKYYNDFVINNNNKHSTEKWGKLSSNLKSLIKHKFKKINSNKLSSFFDEGKFNKTESISKSQKKKSKSCFIKINYNYIKKYFPFDIIDSYLSKYEEENFENIVNINKKNKIKEKNNKLDRTKKRTLTVGMPTYSSLKSGKNNNNDNEYNNLKAIDTEENKIKESDKEDLICENRNNRGSINSFASFDYTDSESENKEKDNNKLIKMPSTGSIKMMSKTNSIQFEEENSDNENELFFKKNPEDSKNNNEFDCQKKLSEINIPYIYYKQLMGYDQYSSTKILNNPKQYFFWRAFPFSFKDYLFSPKKFENLSKCFKVFTRNKKLESSSEYELKHFHLNYPTKIKNFVVDDYYKPFLKVDTKFFKNPLIEVSHSYLNNNFINKKFPEENLTSINFEKFIPICPKSEKLKKIYCENVSANGSIFGALYLTKYFMIFIDKSEIIPYYNEKNMNDENINYKNLMNFVFSREDEEKLKGKNKSILIYYNEIKEIFKRRFCLKHIGYEIFLNDGHSYLFNLFNNNSIDDFTKYVLTGITNTTNKISKNNNIIINDLIAHFEKNGYRSKFKKGLINNFKYLLLLNKYATRSYNDSDQYLVFPVLLIDIEKEQYRDLSKAICLNKPKNELKLKNYISNYNLIGCHFNSHYSTSAFVLYYMVRLSPYSYIHIKFQSGKFDVSERIFNSYKNFSMALQSSEENREWIPEFFHNYEFLLNLNYLNIGIMKKEKTLINNFNTNKFNNIIEFILYNRKLLDKVNIVPWVNNIFGNLQINESEINMNIFPKYSYEQFNNFDKKMVVMKNKNMTPKQIYKNIRNEIAVLNLGITPLQLFKYGHPDVKNKNNRSKKNNNNKDNIFNSNINSRDTLANNPDRNTISLINNTEMNNNINNNSNISFKITEKKNKLMGKRLKEIFKPIKEFISKFNENNKYDVIINNDLINLIFINSNLMRIFNLKAKKDKCNEIKLNTKFVNLPSVKNICCELLPDFYCICRNINKTIILKNNHQSFQYLWFCVITAVEPLDQSKKLVSLIDNYENKIIFGDELGNLCIMEICFKYENQEKCYKVKTIKIIRKVKIHQNFIHNIVYNKRLNIIISASENGDIALNNGYSLDLLNIINLGKKCLIYDIKISFYDLLYVCYLNNEKKTWYIKCLTLNGIKASKLKSQNEIINYFVSDNLMHVYYKNKRWENYLCPELGEKSVNFDDSKNFDEDFKENEEELISCLYCSKLQKLINIYHIKKNNCNELRLQQIEK